MAEIDAVKLKKLKRGEAAGKAATVFCGTVMAYFIAMLIASTATENDFLLEIVLITALPALALGIGASIFCNYKYGAAIEKMIKKYVVETFLENAADMHPERDSLTYFISFENKSAVVKVNGYGKKIIFDFSVFGRLSLSRKSAILNAVETRLYVTFGRLYDGGASFRSVDFKEVEGTRRKSGKSIPIITDGEPDVKAYKIYLKNK